MASKQNPLGFLGTQNNPEEPKKPDNDTDTDTGIDTQERDIPPTRKAEPGEHTSKPRAKKTDRPEACDPAQWERLLSFSRKFHEAKDRELGGMAPLTEAKVVEGARALDNLTRVRGIDSRDVQAVIAWSMEDGFWRTNLRSLAALTQKSKNGDTKYANILAAMRLDIVNG